MARTALYAPAHRVKGRMPPGAGGNPPNLAPSVDWGGLGMQDDRVAFNTQNSAAGAAVFGWHATGPVKVCEQVPSAISTNNLATAQHITNGTPMTLTAGTGITVLASAVYCPASGTTIPAGTLVIDGLPGSCINLATTPGTPEFVRFGANDGTGLYDPTAGISRALSINVSAAVTATITLKGYDFYGFPLTQTVSLAAVTTADTLKTFKFLASATPGTTDGTNSYSIGTTDIYGFGLAADFFADVDVYWANVLGVFGEFAAADNTSPATATTGDVRGKFVAPSASDGTKRLDIFVTPRVKRIAAGTLFGVAQF